MTPEEKEREEQKRERNWDPLTRWLVLQETIAWVDAQQPIPRNSPLGCLRAQARHIPPQQ